MITFSIYSKKDVGGLAFQLFAIPAKKFVFHLYGFFKRTAGACAMLPLLTPNALHHTRHFFLVAQVAS